jgi:hypothetical protein
MSRIAAKPRACIFQVGQSLVGVLPAIEKGNKGPFGLVVLPHFLIDSTELKAMFVNM